MEILEPKTSRALWVTQGLSRDSSSPAVYALHLHT